MSTLHAQPNVTTQELISHFRTPEVRTQAQRALSTYFYQDRGNRSAFLRTWYEGQMTSEIKSAPLRNILFAQSRQADWGRVYDSLLENPAVQFVRELAAALDGSEFKGDPFSRQLVEALKAAGNGADPGNELEMIEHVLDWIEGTAQFARGRLVTFLKANPQPERSSLIDSIKYVGRTLHVKLKHNGATYKYHDVSPETYRAFTTSKSRGAFFNRVIKQHTMST